MEGFLIKVEAFSNWLWGLPFISILLFTVSSGVWTWEGAGKNPSGLTTAAFAEYFGGIGSFIVTISLIFFVLSTMVVLVYYGAKQAEFLFGLKAAKGMEYVYVAAIILGAIGAAEVMWSFLDIALAAILIPNVMAVLLLSKQVKQMKEEFFTSEKYYLKDVEREKEEVV